LATGRGGEVEEEINATKDAQRRAEELDVDLTALSQRATFKSGNQTTVRDVELADKVRNNVRLLQPEADKLLKRMPAEANQKKPTKPSGSIQHEAARARIDAGAKDKEPPTTPGEKDALHQPASQELFDAIFNDLEDWSTESGARGVDEKPEESESPRVSASKSRRLNVVFAEPAYNTLKEMAEQSGKTISEIVRDAIALQKWFTDTRRGGGRILVEERGRVREIMNVR